MRSTKARAGLAHVVGWGASGVLLQKPENLPALSNSALGKSGNSIAKASWRAAPLSQRTYQLARKRCTKARAGLAHVIGWGMPPKTASPALACQSRSLQEDFPRSDSPSALQLYLSPSQGRKCVYCYSARSKAVWSP